MAWEGIYKHFYKLRLQFLRKESTLFYMYKYPYQVQTMNWKRTVSEIQLEFGDWKQQFNLTFYLGFSVCNQGSLLFSNQPFTFFISLYTQNTTFVIFKPIIFIIFPLNVFCLQLQKLKFTCTSSVHLPIFKKRAPFIPISVDNLENSKMKHLRVHKLKKDIDSLSLTY